MPEFEMLCLANSWKHGGRCVAGVLLSDMSWIRPVSDTEDGSLSESACQLDVGRAVRPLDVVRLRVRGPEPRPHQPENWIVTDDQWVLSDSRTAQEAGTLLDSMTVEGPELLGTSSGSVTWKQIQDSELRASLALVTAVAPEFRWSQWSPTQRRAVFSHDGVTYDLPITFEFAFPAQGTETHRSQASWYFTISLGEPYARQGNDCFKLVASAIEIPASV